MIVTGKIKEAHKFYWQPKASAGSMLNTKAIMMYQVVLVKTRKGKVIYNVVMFAGKQAASFDECVSNGAVVVGKTRIDVVFYIKSKFLGDDRKDFLTGRGRWETNLVAENWRVYVAKARRTKEVASHVTGEVFELKGRF